MQKAVRLLTFALAVLLSGQIIRADSYTFTTFTIFPNQQLQAYGINDSGQVTGFTSNPAGVISGFIYQNGASIVFNAPLVGGSNTRSLGINNAGDVAGFTVDSSGNAHGFSDNGGHFLAVPAPGALSTAVYAINDAAQVAGTTGGGSQLQGFSSDPNGNFHTLTGPLGVPFIPDAYNDSGEIGGYYVDSTNRKHAAVYLNGVVTTLPNAYSNVLAIDTAGQMLVSGVGLDGGILNPDGTFVPLVLPASLTLNGGVTGLNDKGQIVGFGSNVAFIGTPVPAVPEPASLVLAGAGLFILCICAFARRRSQASRQEWPRIRCGL